MTFILVKILLACAAISVGWVVTHSVCESFMYKDLGRLGLKVLSVFPDLVIVISLIIVGQPQVILFLGLGAVIFMALAKFGIIVITKGICPSDDSKKVDLPIFILFASVLSLFLFDGKVSVIEGWLLIVFALGRIWALNKPHIYIEEKEKLPFKKLHAIQFILGALIVIFAGYGIVNWGHILTIRLNLSLFAWGGVFLVFVLAVPETITGVIGTIRGNGDEILRDSMAIATLRGAFFVGLSGILGEGVIGTKVQFYDSLIIFFSVLLLGVLCFLRRRVRRQEGVLALIFYCFYILSVFIDGFRL